MNNLIHACKMFVYIQLELSTRFTCSTLKKEGGYFPSFPNDISTIVDEWNANINDDALLKTTCEKSLHEDKGTCTS